MIYRRGNFRLLSREAELRYNFIRVIKVDIALWGSFELEGSSLYEVNLGNLFLRFQIRGDELQYAAESGDSGFACTPLHPVRWKRTFEDLTWHRCILYEENTNLRIKPILPDKPVLVRTMKAVQIPPGRGTVFYFQMPVWVRLEIVTAKSGDILLGDYPTESMSKTWFGDPINGELSYALRTRAVRLEENLKEESHVITCPMTIRNGTEVTLTFERINLQVEYMSVFSSGNRLWTNAASVVFRGPDQFSQINFSSLPPKIVRNPKKWSEPRLNIAKNLMRKSFLFLKKLTGL